jgi:hypothetical protein
VLHSGPCTHLATQQTGVERFVGFFLRFLLHSHVAKVANRATLAFRMAAYLLKTGEAYVEQSAGEFEEQRRERELRQLTRRASRMTS